MNWNNKFIIEYQFAIYYKKSTSYINKSCKQLRMNNDDSAVEYYYTLVYLAVIQF